MTMQNRFPETGWHNPASIAAVAHANGINLQDVAETPSADNGSKPQEIKILQGHLDAKNKQVENAQNVIATLIEQQANDAAEKHSLKTSLTQMETDYRKLIEDNQRSAEAAIHQLEKKVNRIENERRDLIEANLNLSKGLLERCYRAFGQKKIKA